MAVHIARNSVWLIFQKRAETKTAIFVGNDLFLREVQLVERRVSEDSGGPDALLRVWCSSNGWRKWLKCTL